VFARRAASSAVLIFNSGPAHGESVGTYRGDLFIMPGLNPDEYTALAYASCWLKKHPVRAGLP
jgi:hypothetical protein